MPDKKTALWDAVCETDPNYTTTVNQRGGFTAIGAQYQIKCATEQFGSFGIGWGVKDEKFTFEMDNRLVVYQAELFYTSNGVEGSVPIHSSCTTSWGTKLDDDCIKKVATDALTKGLSKLGFNADVFMGQFDDNKYVSTLETKYGSKNKAQSKPQSNKSADLDI